MIAVILILVAVGVYLAIKWSSRNFNFFEKQGIKYIKPYPFIGTNKWLITRQSVVKIIHNFYSSFPEEKIFGLFTCSTPCFVIRDPDLLKQLTIKEFEHFPDHPSLFNTEADELFGSLLIAMKGKKWKEMRTALSPAFTGSKMRLMFEFVSAVGKQMADYYRDDIKIKGVGAYEMKVIFSRFTNDVIASCAFGVKCDSFNNPRNEFYQIGQKISNFRNIIMLVRFLMIRYFPALSKQLGVQYLSKATKAKFYEMIIETMKIRERENIVRPDMINLLMQLKKGALLKMKVYEQAETEGIATVKEEAQAGNSEAKRSWSDNELIAQCFIFFLAGFDTSSGLLSFAAYELATNPEIQRKLVQEISEANENLAGKPLNYVTLYSMKYMDMVISESLRKWPPAFLIDRECAKDFIYEDTDDFKFKMKKGSFFWIPIYSFHMDPKYFSEPEKFDPERFSDENKSKINFNAYMPFGIGPRSCIGSRFALMQIKTALYYLLLHFTFEVCSETQIPIKLGASFVGLIPDKKIKLILKPRT